MALTEVSAFKNLSIINEDINASAAIAGSKISPDFGSQNIVTTGTVGGLDLSTYQANGGSYLRSDADDGFTGTITGTGDGTNPVIIINGGGPNIIRFDRNTGDSSDSIDLVYRTNPNTLAFERVSDSQIMFSVDADDQQAIFNGNVNCNLGLDVTGGPITGVLGSAVTATTQSAGDNSIKIATTAYVDGASVSTEQVQDIVGAMFTGNTETNITATYQDSDGTIDLVASGGGGGSSSQLTDTNGTVKVEVDTSTIFLKDLVEVRDSIPQIHFKSSDGNTPYGWFKSHSQGIEILQRVANKDIKIRQKGTSEYTKILIRDGLSGNSGTTDVCIGRSMGSSGKPTDLNAFFPFEGGVELYHIASGTGTKKFETTANGITVQGSVTTEDINMSNLNASANEVDNTKGSWTIQEGASDLFLINRVNGKKYKFNLTEIS